MTSATKLRGKQETLLEDYESKQASW